MPPLTKGHLVVVAGNFGVGKSTLLYAPDYRAEPFFCHRPDGWAVFGSKIIGADSLSGYRKQEAQAQIARRPDLNVLVAGVYYAGKIDLIRYRGSHRVHLLILSTSKAENRTRITGRGGTFVEKTWADKNNQILALEAYARGQGIPVTRLDNNRPLQQTRTDFEAFLRSLTS